MTSRLILPGKRPTILSLRPTLYLSASRTWGFAAGNPVGSVLDLSGHGNAALQTTSGYKPTWSSSGFVFDGVDDYLLVSQPALSEFGPELLANGSFAYTGTPDDNTNDTFASWTNVNGGDTVARAVTTGPTPWWTTSQSLKIGGTSQTGLLRQSGIAVTPGNSMRSAVRLVATAPLLPGFRSKAPMA
jgi:hypothetical protein